MPLGDDLTQQVVDLFERTVNETALGLRVSVEGALPSVADEISHAELVEYTFRMLEAVQTATTAIASHVEALATRIVALEAR